MSSFSFPTLDSVRGEIRPPAAKTNESTAWVQNLHTTSAPAAAPVASKGWSPPSMATVAIQTKEKQAGPTSEELRQQAKEEGFKQGYSEGQSAGIERGMAEGRMAGREEGKAEVLAAESAHLMEFRAALADQLTMIQPAIDAWKVSVETRAAELAMQMVKSLLASELETGRDTALGIVREVLGFAEGERKATIRLSPFDRAILSQKKDEIIATCVGLRELELVDDPSVVGGCIVETEGGIIDAQLETRVTLMEAA